MTKQLTLSGEREHKSVAISLPRGDTKAIEEWEHDLQASEVNACKFTIKNSSGTAVVELTTTAHASQFDVATDNEVSVTLLAADTEGLELASGYKYGLEFTDNSSRIYTPYTGSVTFIDDVVYDDDTAAYLSWTTLDSYESVHDALLACVNATRTTAAASSGASAVVVATPGLFTVTDDIITVYDDGTYGKHAIDTIVTATGTINLDGTTLGDDVASGNIVQRVG